MLTNYELRLVLHYLANAAASLHHRDPAAKDLIEWVIGDDGRDAFTSRRRRTRAPGARGAGLNDLSRHPAFTNLADHNDRLSAAQWRRAREVLRNQCQATKHVRSDLTGRRLRQLAAAIGLSRTDVAILDLMLRYATQPIIESMVDGVFHTRAAFGVKEPALPACLGLSSNTILARLHGGAPLVRSGLVGVDDNDGELRLADRMPRLAVVPSAPGVDVNHLLLGAAAKASDLEWSDFDHVAQSRDHIERLLKGALESGASGVNILLYGAPGTGKTEFCKVLAGKLGVDLHSVAEADEAGDEPSRGERLQELRLAQRLLAQDRASLLLFDEMEDLLSTPFAGFGLFLPRTRRRFGTGGESKVYFNRLLEETPVPTLWTINDAGAVDPAVLRRMMFALELRLPPPKVRARVWTRQLARHGIEAGPEDAFALAREFEATPGVAAGATAAARLGGGDLAAVRRGVDSLSRVLSCKRPSKATPDWYDPALIRADTNPMQLADRLESTGERGFSLCLQGPPGTGKSAFVRYLADRLGLEVLQRRASDLMSPYVGETEQRIAGAFAEARDSGAFLVFDEADSLLADRRFAHRSWEVSQVNEMLTWMESHPAPFACTTNFGEHLDPATMRRFVFKVTLDYLSPEQVVAAFRSRFGCEPPAAAMALPTLTPGDFAVVHRRAEVLGCLAQPDALAAMLREECDAKPDRPQGIGFHP